MIWPVLNLSQEAQNMDEAIIKKIMPHSIDSEKAVIGSMIMDADLRCLQEMIFISGNLASFLRPW